MFSRFFSKTCILFTVLISSNITCEPINPYPPIFYSQQCSFLNAIHVTASQKYSLELLDGSHWMIDTYDNSKALTWRQNDPLIITQNHSWFSHYRFRIINQATGAYIQANLHKGPFENGQFTRYISNINSNQTTVILSDNSRWEISPQDLYIFNNWIPSDCIIIGANTGWDTTKEAILINVNTNNFVRASEF